MSAVALSSRFFARLFHCDNGGMVQRQSFDLQSTSRDRSLEKKRGTEKDRTFDNIKRSQIPLKANKIKAADPRQQFHGHAAADCVLAVVMLRFNCSSPPRKS